MSAVSTLAILIINYRSPAYTVDCLRSLAGERAGIDFIVWLLDNASGDGSALQIREAMDENGWASWVRFIESEENLGFAGGNNLLLGHVLAEEAPPPYLLLLNNDTVVHPGCLTYVVSRLGRDPSIALLSCHLQNGDGTVQNVARRMPTPLTETLTAFGLPYILPRLFGWADIEDRGWDRETTEREVGWLGGAFMCMPIGTARTTGLFDTDFFFYGEDIELCHRIRKTVGRIVFSPGARTVHFGGGSSDAKKMLNRRRDILHWRARFLVQEKCFGPFAARWVRAMYILGFYSRKYRFILSGRRNSDTYREILHGIDVLTHLEEAI